MIDPRRGELITWQERKERTPADYGIYEKRYSAPETGMSDEEYWDKLTEMEIDNITF